ncbi:chemotaxis protein CheW [Janthinobacterium sp. HH103]|uniref:chemotaxis protein CheW n=1 Tax=unclassified Janthinobacterium TaxID=2610881 RepID=UPI00089415A1|nr:MULTISPECIES: chemotaxis protein CheW [unclassified Janthinobacterium]OEZ72773.1 chemotaxis protein CheW [Janthinobacterium sp. HH100]OEZ86727.1 chemotaxis protein CheW [Janthinobacterium sp. HH103]QOU73833.1 CheW-like domain protein [Janthinobacterium sp. HH102]
MDMHEATGLQAHGANDTAAELFGSFHLGGDEFALPASCIREVVNYPAKVTALSLSPAYLEGMFTLRGSVIPVVNLGRLFRADAPRAVGTDKIAILDFQQVLIGIVFQDTGEILRVPASARSALQYAASDSQAVIAGTILLDGGARLLQILDPHALLRIENVPHVLALQATGAKLSTARYHAQSERRQCVSFHAAGATFAFEMLAIQEIIKVPELHSSVLNNELCLGRMHFRGNQVAVVDFGALLQAPAYDKAAREATPDQRVIVVRLDGTTVGFLVDSVDSIVHFFGDQVLPIPLLSKARAAMFAGCITKEGLGDIIFLNHKDILSQAEIVEMRDGHARLYPADTEMGAATHKARRRVYITFTVETRFAVEIGQVREIIDFSHAITTPPGMPACMLGMLNLRQQMISIIDLRQLYAMPALPDASSGKILIVERGAERYGFLVDHVDNIMTISDSQRFAAPQIIRTGEHDDLRSEMDEMIDIGTDAQRQTLSVFQCDHLLEKLETALPRAA